MSDGKEFSDAETPAINLFRYFLDLTRLRSKVIRDVNNYESILWYSEIPKENECHTPFEKLDKRSHESWLEIEKPEFEPVPDIPKELKPWVRESELSDSTKTPQILEKIIVEDVTDESETPEFRFLKEHPHIAKQWQEYLEEQWLRWAEENERLKKIQNAYAQLHEIYQKQKRLGETYELIVGLGLLTWRTPSSQRVRRHLITAQATIQLDTKRGTLIVQPGAEGAKPNLEQEMLEAPERPDTESQISIENQIKKIGDNIWSTKNIYTILKSWVFAVSADGHFSDNIIVEDGFQNFPKVTYAPALILRRRTNKGLISTFQEISNQLLSGVEPPLGVERIVEILDEESDLEKHNGGTDSDLQFMTEILFPLPSNDEQTQIIKNIRRRKGVLVQGPPGTGKSHTITNLICHLLAEGNRVLVTSQTPRALKVLKKMIPKNIQNLCVSLLGNDSFALKELEDSVRGITDKRNDWDEKSTSSKIARLMKELDDLRRQESELRRQFCEIRERETYVHRICDGRYSGTAQNIAEQVSKGSQFHKWLDIRVEVGQVPPLSNQEALELLKLHQQLTEQRMEEARQSYVSPDQLPSVDDIVVAIEKERQAKTYFDSFSDVQNGATYNKLLMATTEQLTSVKNKIQKFLDLRNNVLKHRLNWVSAAVHDITSENDRLWRELWNSTKNLLNGLMEEARKAENFTLELPDGYNRFQVLTNARTLRKYFRGGGKLGILLPKSVKNAWGIIKHCRINGRPCDDPEVLRDLINVLTVDERLERLWKLWTPHAQRIHGNRPMQVGVIEDFCEPLIDALKLHGLMASTRKACSSINGLTQPSWHIIEEVDKYQRTIHAVGAERKSKNSKSVFDGIEKKFHAYVSKPNTHPAVEQAHKAIVNRDLKSYSKILDKFRALEQDQRLIDRRNLLHKKLSDALPELAKRIKSDPLLADWSTRLSNFVESWYWAQANTWLNEYVSGLDEEEISIKLNRVQSEIRKTVEQLCALMAWGHCFKKLKESERQHLMAWALEIKKIGRGKGKRAEIHRRAARENMEQCRGAIPAWIMPLYRVAETVNPSVDSFDVAIIDEASQSGPEALFLLFLANKVIVVGDDEQISPENIGVLREDVDALQERYLKQIPLPHKSALGVESSFFDLANIIFPGRIILREHFRCMPEIIQFSNNLCYRNTPLIPLRQYRPNRLEPIRTVHVKDGYRDGNSIRSINRPEAEAIAQRIANCCEDSAYTGKTMGIISLLGEYQARLIERLLFEAIGPEEMERRNIVCGDAYAFQGDERDVVFLSMVAAPGETSLRALTGARYKRRFNVAASRARDQMWLFHTPTLNDFRNKECLRFQLLSYCLNPTTESEILEHIDIQKLKSDSEHVNRNKFDPPEPFQSWFEVDVFLKIIDKGYRVIPQFKVAGFFIDFVVEGIKGRLAVECDGDEVHSTTEQIVKDEQRQRILERCGWTFWRVRGSEYYHNPTQALESLWVQLYKLGIESCDQTKTEAS